MRLWSIQPLAVWEKLQKFGTLNNSEAYTQQDFLPAYRWMAGEMTRRIGPSPYTDALPFWAWFQAYDSKRPRPDLRRSAHLPAGSSGVRITLQMVSEQVLLSDFELWHYVLNHWYLPTSMKDSETFEEQTHDEKTDIIIRESWQRIFDLKFSATDIAAPLAKKSLQATFWELRLENVIEVQSFLAR